MDSSVPRSKRLLTDERSNIFVYMTGHGGNEFLKFQDNEEISAFDIADAFEQMYQKKRYFLFLLLLLSLPVSIPCFSKQKFQLQWNPVHGWYMSSQYHVFPALLS